MENHYVPAAQWLSRFYYIILRTYIIIHLICMATIIKLVTSPSYRCDYFRGFERYKDAQTPRDHRVLQDKSSSTEWLPMPMPWAMFVRFVVYCVRVLTVVHLCRTTIHRMQCHDQLALYQVTKIAQNLHKSHQPYFTSLQP